MWANVWTNVWTKFLQICSFSIILTSLRSLNLSFPLLFYVNSTALLKFSPWFPASPPWFPTFFAFSHRFPAFPHQFPSPAFPSHLLCSYPYFPHFPHSVPKFNILVFSDSLLSLQLLRISFRKIVALVEKRTLPFVTTT